MPVDPRRPDWGKVRCIASAIRRGAVVAMPTDTVYGLAANPYDDKAVRRLFRLKRRPETKPILLLIDGWQLSVGCSSGRVGGIVLLR